MKTFMDSEALIRTPLGIKQDRKSGILPTQQPIHANKKAFSSAQQKSVDQQDVAAFDQAFQKKSKIEHDTANEQPLDITDQAKDDFFLRQPIDENMVNGGGQNATGLSPNVLHVKRALSPFSGFPPSKDSLSVELKVPGKEVGNSKAGTQKKHEDMNQPHVDRHSPSHRSYDKPHRYALRMEDLRDNSDSVINNSWIAPQPLPQAVQATQTARAPVTTEEFVALIEQHVDRLLMSEKIEPGKVGSQVLITLKEPLFDQAPLMLTRTQTGWSLKSNGLSEENGMRIKRHVPRLVERFSERGLGDLEVELISAVEGVGHNDNYGATG